MPLHGAPLQMAFYTIYKLEFTLLLSRYNADID
jgi:hypothetical protein